MDLLYKRCPRLCLHLGVLLKCPIIFTLTHIGLQIFTPFPILSLLPYGKTVLSFLIQCSFRQRKDVLKVGLLMMVQFVYKSHFRR
jgi:hypothetical protein